MKQIFLLSIVSIHLSTEQLKAQLASYLPSVANVSGFTQAREAKLSLGQKSGQTLYFGSFSPIENYSIGVSLYRPFVARTQSYHRAEYPTGKSFKEGSSVELQASWYRKFGSNGRFEITAGFGKGSYRANGEWATGEKDTVQLITSNYSSFLAFLSAMAGQTYTPDYDTSHVINDRKLFFDYSGKYRRYFMQPAIGAGNDKLSVMGGIKISMQQYFEINVDNEEYKNRHGDVIDEFTTEIFLTYQPFVHLEAGWPWVKAYCQLGFSGGGGNGLSGSSEHYASLGLTVHFAPRHLKKGWWE